MGFGTELQGHPSHTALLQLQDAEIRLLENIKKCVSQRIKCDRDYASALSGMVTTAHKLESSEFNTPLFQAWSTVINETENIIKLIKENADKMCTHTLERLVLVINEKKTARKTYSEEHHRLESEFNKLDDSANKQQTEISRLVAKVVQDRSKYEEVCHKGKGGSKLEDSRNRYTRSETKLQVTHNDYVRILKEVSIHQQGYVRTTLPDLLNLQETIQKQLVQQSKEILEDCISHMDHSSESYKNCHSSMYRSVDSIKVAGVYDDFLNKYKSDPLSLSKYEYKTSLLDNYKGTAVVGEFAINSLTLESLKQRCSDYKNNLTSCQSRKDLKTDELTQLKNELGTLQSSDTKHFIKLKAVEVLEWDIGELECNENKLKVMNEIMTNALQTLSDSPVPAGLEFSDSIPPSGSKEQLEAHESSNLSQKMKSTFGKAKLFKRSQLSPAQDAPEPPLKDFFDPGNAPDTSHEREWHMVETVENSSHGSLEPGYQPCDFPGGAASKTDSVTAPDLHDEEWFHGLLPREEVQRLLVNNGDFLVRESKNRKTKELQYVLSVMWNGHKHFIIQGEEGNWRFEAEVFATIGDLIQNQFLSNVPVTKKSEAILKNPICKMDWEIRNDDVVLGTHIDKGNFGEVFRGTYKNMDVAIKTCRETLSEEMKRKFLQEGRILKQYNHPNIVRFIGIAAQKQPVMIVMEFVDGGSLLNFLKKKGASIPKPSLIKMCEDAGKGMSYLESKNCIHRDLAARNCLVDEIQNVTKISDFGMSREEEEYTVSGGLKQIPIKWTAPEALNYGTYTSASDIWSFGILMWEVFAFGKIPYPGLTNTQARERIEEGYRMPAPEGCPKSVYNLMVMCWEHEPKQRPLFATLYKSLHKVRIEAEQ